MYAPEPFHPQGRGAYASSSLVLCTYAIHYTSKYALLLVVVFRNHPLIQKGDPHQPHSLPLRALTLRRFHVLAFVQLLLSICGEWVLAPGVESVKSIQ